MQNRMERRSRFDRSRRRWCGGPRASAAEPAGAVETSRGECYAQTAAERRTLAPAAAVFVGDAVGTGVQSALAMRLGTATQVKLGAEARLRIDRFLVNAGGVLVLERGGMLYDHDTSAGPSDVTVRGPFGLVAVRGTRFFAGPSNGVFGVFVERGDVTVLAFTPRSCWSAGRAPISSVLAPSRRRLSHGARPASPVRWHR